MRPIFHVTFCVCHVCHHERERVREEGSKGAKTVKKETLIPLALILFCYNFKTDFAKQQRLLTTRPFLVGGAAQKIIMLVVP